MKKIVHDISLEKTANLFAQNWRKSQKNCDNNIDPSCRNQFKHSTDLKFYSLHKYVSSFLFYFCRLTQWLKHKIIIKE
jgi:hypothetical protein